MGHKIDVSFFSMTYSIAVVNTKHVKLDPYAETCSFHVLLLVLLNVNQKWNGLTYFS
jgi:hypothetical protein